MLILQFTKKPDTLSANADSVKMAKYQLINQMN